MDTTLNNVVRHISGHASSCENYVVIVRLLSHVQLFVTPWTAACQAPLSSTVSQGLLKLMSIESVMLSNYLFLCCPLLLLPLIFPSSVQLLSRFQIFATLWTTARQASLSITNSRSLPKLMSIESVMLSNYLILSVCWRKSKAPEQMGPLTLLLLDTNPSRSVSLSLSKGTYPGTTSLPQPDIFRFCLELFTYMMISQ